MTIAYRNIARVVRPHGKRGEVTVQPVRGLPFLVETGMRVALTPPGLNRDRFCTVRSVSDTGQDWLVSFSGIDDIDAAESVRGCFILVRADDIQLDELDAAWDDLIDRPVIDVRFGELGVVRGIIETPANDVLQVSGPYGEVLIPIIEQALDSLPDEGPISTHIMDGLIDADALERVRSLRRSENSEHAEGEGSC